MVGRSKQKRLNIAHLWKQPTLKASGLSGIKFNSEKKGNKIG